MSNIFENKGAMAATIVVAASNSLNRGAANYVCAGVADNVEINAALAALPAAGGRVLLLEGNYTTIANITVPANATLEGQGKATIITPTGAAITNGIVLNGDNITLKNMKVILAAGAGAGGTRPNVVYATGRTLLWLENLWTVGDTSVADDGSFFRQNGVYLTACTECKILNCRIEDNKRYGIELHNGSNANTVIGNSCQGNTAAGIFLYTNCNYNTVTGNTCQGNTTTGIYVAGTSNYNTVTGNTCQGNTATGITIENSLGNTVTGNTCIGNTTRGIFINGSSYSTIAGNVCQGNTFSGIELTASTYNTITGNTCQVNTRRGILLTSASISNTVTGNICRGNGTGTTKYSGIYIDTSDQNVITGNECNTNGLHGISVFRSSYCTVTGNGCNGSTTADGINLTGDATTNSDYNTITGNVCTGNASNGIKIVGGVNANRNMLKGNDTYGNTSRGVVDAGTNTIFDQAMHSIALDLTGGATDIEAFFAKCPCILAGYSILYSVATGAGAGVNIRVGRYQDGVALDNAYFDISVSEINKNKGYSKHFVSADLTQTVIAAADTITVGTAGGKADTGKVILVVEIAEMSN